LVKEIAHGVKGLGDFKRPLKIIKTIEKAFKEGQPERGWLLAQLSGLVNYAKIKIMDSNTDRSDRIKWSRILVAAASACSRTLSEKQLDEIETMLKEMKRKVME